MASRDLSPGEAGAVYIFAPLLLIGTIAALFYGIREENKAQYSEEKNYETLAGKVIQIEPGRLGETKSFTVETPAGAFAVSYWGKFNTPEGHIENLESITEGECVIMGIENPKRLSNAGGILKLHSSLIRRTDCAVLQDY